MVSNNNSTINFSKISKGHVYLREELAGIIEKGANEFTFKYTENWIDKKKSSISTSLPVRATPYVAKKLHPFFDNLIAEGWLLGYAEKVFQIDKSNRFAMLMAIGQSTIGAVRIKPVLNNKVISLQKYYAKDLIENDLSSYSTIQGHNNLCALCLEELTKTEITKKKRFHLKCSREMWGTTRAIEVLLEPTKPLNSFRNTIYGGTISGAQRKGLFHLEKNKLWPTSFEAQYILKPQGDYDELPENEHATMVIARKIGFNVPPISILDIKGLGKVFAIKRFDIFKGESLRKEDMAQILNTYSADKYELSYEKIAKAIIKLSSAPVIDIEAYWRRLIFCYLTANADMHLKNWSLLENKKMNNSLELSPCYDLLNTRIAIPAEKEDTALFLCGKKGKIQKSYFLRFAKEFKIKDQVIATVFKELEQWLNIIKEVIPKSYLSKEAQDTYIKLAEERYSILMK